MRMPLYYLNVGPTSEIIVLSPKRKKREKGVVFHKAEDFGNLYASTDLILNNKIKNTTKSKTTTKT